MLPFFQLPFLHTFYCSFLCLWWCVAAVLLNLQFQILGTILFGKLIRWMRHVTKSEKKTVDIFGCGLSKFISWHLSCVALWSVILCIHYRIEWVYLCFALFVHFWNKHKSQGLFNFSHTKETHTHIYHVHVYFAVRFFLFFLLLFFSLLFLDFVHFFRLFMLCSLCLTVLQMPFDFISFSLFVHSQLTLEIHVYVSVSASASMF